MRGGIAAAPAMRQVSPLLLRICQKSQRMRASQDTEKPQRMRASQDKETPQGMSASQ